MWGREGKLVRLNQELETLAVFDRIYDLDPNPSRNVNAAYVSRQKRRSEIGAEIANLEAGKRWLKVSQKHLVRALTTQVETARLLLRFCSKAGMTAALVLRRLEDRIHELCAKSLIARGTEQEAILEDLQSALRQHARRLREVAILKLVNGGNDCHPERRST
jgi:hypothetical protein